MVNIKVGLSTLFCLGKPFSNLCQQLRKVEVKHVELVDDGRHGLNNKRVKTLEEISKLKGLTYTLHAPFANINIAALDYEMRDFFFKRLEKSMIFASRLECRLMVFHPGLQTGISSFYPNLDWKLNVKSIKKLLAMSRKHHIEISVENMPEPFGFLTKNVKDFSQFFDELGEEISLVLDIGHSNISNQTHMFIEAFGEKLVHVHAHDNDGKHDLHLGVGRGTVDWQQFADDLRKANFKGTVIVESYQNLAESISKLQKLL